MSHVYAVNVQRLFAFEDSASKSIQSYQLVGTNYLSDLLGLTGEALRGMVPGSYNNLRVKLNVFGLDKEGNKAEGKRFYSTRDTISNTFSFF